MVDTKCYFICGLLFQIGTLFQMIRIENNVVIQKFVCLLEMKLEMYHI